MSPATHTTPRVGFYVQRYSTAYPGSAVSLEGSQSSPSSSGRSVVFSQVKAAPHDEQLYLYQLPDAEPSVPSSWGWIVGDHYGVDAGPSARWNMTPLRVSRCDSCHLLVPYCRHRSHLHSRQSGLRRREANPGPRLALHPSKRRADMGMHCYSHHICLCASNSTLDVCLCASERFLHSPHPLSTAAT